MQSMHPPPIHHPRPSVADALERGHLRRAASERTQRTIWVAFYIGLGVLLAIGLAAGLLHHSPAAGEEALPPAPVVR